MTGIGPVGVRQPRVRDREAGADDPERIRFTPMILPPYARRSKSLEMLLPILYLKGISTGDFEEALAALLGKDASGLSASTIARLKDVWVDEHKRWNERDLSAKRYVYIWADGIHLQARLEDDAQCILVVIGATPEGKKELIGFTDGTRESAQDWSDLLVDLKNRGLTMAAEDRGGRWRTRLLEGTRPSLANLPGAALLGACVDGAVSARSFLERFERVIECGHVSGLCVRRRAWPLAGMAMRGPGPNRKSELWRSMNPSGFPDPDLVDHVPLLFIDLLTPPTCRGVVA